MAVNLQHTHYDVLAVRDDAPVGVIRAAYREMAKHHHPDRVGGDAALFSEMTEAMSVLTDARARASYDRELRNSRPATARNQAPRTPVVETPAPAPAYRTGTASTTSTRRPTTTTTARRPTPVPAPQPPPGAASGARPLQLWLPMTVAVALSLVAGLALARANAGAGGGQRFIDAVPLTALSAGMWLLVGGHLLERRNALAQIGTPAVAGICAAWALAAALKTTVDMSSPSAVLPGMLTTSATYAAVEWLSVLAGPLLFLAVVTAGVLASDGARARDWRNLYLRRLARETAKEAGLCVWAVLRDLGSIAKAAASGLGRLVVQAFGKG